MYVIDNELYHHGVLGMKWGVRRYQSYAENPKLSDRKKMGGRSNDTTHNKVGNTNEVAKSFAKLLSDGNTPYNKIEDLKDKYSDAYEISDDGYNVIVSDKKTGKYTTIPYSNKKRDDADKKQSESERLKVESMKRQPYKKVNDNPKNRKEFMDAMDNIVFNMCKKYGVPDEAYLSDAQVGEMMKQINKLETTYNKNKN